MEPLRGQWVNLSGLGHLSYVCGFCGEKTGVKEGYYNDAKEAKIYICGGCNRPTYFEERTRQTPAQTLGNDVLHLPEMIDSLYQESRHCTQVEAYTACVLTCRKILMHIAVEKGAPTNQYFIQYVEYLAENNFVPPGSEGWVDRIRQRSNEANHEIVLMKKDDAFELLSFVELLLKYVFEFPARIMPPSTSEEQSA